MTGVLAAVRALVLALAILAVTVVLWVLGLPFGLVPLIPIILLYMYLIVNDFVVTREAKKNLDADYQNLLDGYKRDR